jgi:hypothetical protein
MPRCSCGFDFVKAAVKVRPLTSYVLIPNKGYRAAIMREHAIVIEKQQGRKLRLIARASPTVGSLTRCPKCGAWLLAQPLKSSRGKYAILRSQPTNRGNE